MKKTGRLLALSAAAVCSLGVMTSCNKTGFKVGLLCLHGQTSTYDKNFIEAFEKACKDNDLVEGKGYEIRTDVKEDYNDIYTAAKEWAEDGYSMVFADSFGHQYGLIDVAKEYPNTEFCHATGTTALLNYEEGLMIHNYHTAFANIFKGRYLAGVAAGQKMVEDIEANKYTIDQAKIGYVGAWPYAEVISGYTSFYLGACSIFDSIPEFAGKRPEMIVKYTYSWYDYGAEKEAAFELIRKHGCKLISQHADSMGAPQACASEKIPNVCYNVSTKAKTPNTYLFGSKINWYEYFDHIIERAKAKYYDKEDPNISTDYVGDLEPFDYEDGQAKTEDQEGMVQTLEFGSIASDKVIEKVQDARDALTDATNPIHVFDCRKFKISIDNFGENDPRNHNPFANVAYQGTPIPNHTKNASIDWYEANVIDDPKYFSDTVVTKSATDPVTTDEYSYIDESGYDMDNCPTSISSNSFRSAPFFELIIDGITTLN